MVAADFSGDGRPDVAVCTGSGGAAGVAIFLNKGDGTLLSPVVYGTGSGVTLGLASIDLNRDGHPDLVAFSNSGLNVLLNTGNGTFTAGASYPLSGYMYTFIAGDFNGDGKKDVAVSYLTSSFVPVNVIYLNNGDGTLTRGSTFTAPGNPGGCCGQVQLADAADLNGDGVDDIITSEFDDGFATLFGTRAGVMSAPLVYTQFFSYPTLHLIDVTGDGKPDLVVGNQYAVFSVLPNNGAGLFGTPVAIDPGNYGYGMTIVIADFDKNGSIDVVGGPFNDARNLYLFANDGLGNFGPPVIQSSGVDTCCGGGLANAVADFDGDGLLDIAYAHSDRTPEVVILRNTSVVSAATTAITNVFPKEAGNAGSISSFNIIGTGFPSNVQVTLVGPGGTISSTSINVAPSGTLITCSFDLTGVTPGNYKLVLTIPGGAVIASEASAFTVDQGGAPSIQSDLVGLTVLKGGLAQVFYVTCTNNGNLDAAFATVSVSFPNYITWASGSPGASITTESVGQSTLLAVDFLSIPVGATQVVPIVLTAPTAFSYAHQPIVIQVWNAQ